MDYYESRRRSLPFYYAKLAKYLEFFKGQKRVLELGCGQGDFLFLMKSAGQAAEGIDLDPACVNACKSRGLAVTQQDALKAVAKAKGRYDALFCSNVVEHLSPAQLSTLFDSAARALPGGGKLGLNTANPQSLGIHADSFWHDPTHVRMYPAPLLKRMLEERGFEVLIAGPDKDTRSNNPLRSAIRALRTLLIGDYFGPPEICVLAVKR